MCVTIITVFAGCWILNISFISLWHWQWWSVHLWSPAMSHQICSLKGALLERPQRAGLRIREVIWHKNLCQTKHESICFSSFKDFVSVDSRITLKYRGLTKPNYMIYGLRSKIIKHVIPPPLPGCNCGSPSNCTKWERGIFGPVTHQRGRIPSVRVPSQGLQGKQTLLTVLMSACLDWVIARCVAICVSVQTTFSCLWMITSFWNLSGELNFYLVRWF